MHPSRLSPDDPRLTAYAFGELDSTETTVVEAALRANPALQAEVEGIRRCGAELSAALAAEPLPTALPAAPPRSRAPAPTRRWNPFPQLYYVAGGLAAAGVAVLVTFHRDDILERERQRHEARREQAAQGAEASTALVAVGFAAGAVDDAATMSGRGAPASGSIVLVPGFGEAALAAVRRHLDAGHPPPPEAVRPAEFVNAFRYGSPPPPEGNAVPLAAALELGDAPWAPERRLVRIGLQAREEVLAETREGLVDGIARTHAGIARDVRITVEFNPALVAGYRLIGRERETAARATPVDELATAPELAPGQAFTALYEIVPVVPFVREARAGELLTVRLQFDEPAGGPRRTLEFSLAGRNAGAAAPPVSADFQLAAAAAEFARVLQQGPTRADAATLRRLEERVAAPAPGAPEEGGNRGAELAQLVRRVQALLE